ncbi:hypothetical protein PCANC_22258, partial [Puccinia coronata f. sp. avenae]
TIVSVLVLVGLVAFNVFTQGYVYETESVLRGHWYTKNDSLSCQPAAMVMGNSYFTNSPPTHPGDNAEVDKEAASGKRGSFSWSLQSVTRGLEGQDTGETGFYYEESPLSCNITGISLTYEFYTQSCSYSIAAMCVTRSAEKDVMGNYTITLKTRYSTVDEAVPKFTAEVQRILQAQIFGISKYYPQLNFSANAFPSSAFPPYTDLNNRLAQQGIDNQDFLQWSVWLDGFNYTITDHYRDFNHSHLYMQPEPQGTLFLSDAEAQPVRFDEGLLTLIQRGGSSNLQIAVVGIGGVRPIPLNGTLSEVQLLPAPMPLYFNLTESILAIMMDMAGEDLHQRVLGAGYLCTITRNPLKKPIPMIAMIFGSCSGMFGAALTIMLFVARRFDSHLIMKHERRATADSTSSENQLMDYQPDELMLESQAQVLHKDRDRYPWKLF